MLSTGDQVVWFIQHAVQVEARRSREAEDLWRSVVKRVAWGKNELLGFIHAESSH